VYGILKAGAETAEGIKVVAKKGRKEIIPVTTFIGKY
jgi:hypothetical protein